MFFSKLITILGAVAVGFVHIVAASDLEEIHRVEVFHQTSNDEGTPEKRDAEDYLSRVGQVASLIEELVADPTFISLVDVLSSDHEAAISSFKSFQHNVTAMAASPTAVMSVIQDLPAEARPAFTKAAAAEISYASAHGMLAQCTECATNGLFSGAQPTYSFKSDNGHGVTGLLITGLIVGIGGVMLVL